MNKTSLNEEISQIKIYTPGCQILYKNTIDLNEKYFVFSATMSIIIYSLKTKRLINIITSNSEKYLRIAALNKGNSSVIAYFYGDDIEIVDFKQNKLIKNINLPNANFFEFNSNNILLISTTKNELFLYEFKNSEAQLKNIKTCGNVIFCKWFPFNEKNFVYINSKNEIYLCETNQNKKYLNYLDLETENEIADGDWYKSDEKNKYFIIGFKNTEMKLIDINENNPCVIMNFNKHGNSLNKVIFLKNEPGNFISILNNSTKISFWNVSNNICQKVEKFVEFPILNCVQTNDGKNLLMSLNNGIVIMYDLSLKKNVFNTLNGHSETIFDLQFSPFNNDCFATCSFDGIIKIWNYEKNEIVANLNIPENKNDKNIQIFTIQFSPVEKNVLLCGDSNSNLRLWNINSRKNYSTLCLNKENKAKILGIDWKFEFNILATCLNRIYLVSLEGGKLFLNNEIKLETNLFQIKFSTENNNFFAVACEDAIIRIYNTNLIKEKINEEKEIKKLIGHTQKVFGLCYHPLKNILASSSDDFKIGIWDLSKEEKNINFLIGHSNKIRTIKFFNENHSLLISGSWDETVRIWNIDLLICVSIIKGHQNHIYGLDICPSHPFLILTSSRDNSIRFWNYLKNNVNLIIGFENENYLENKSDLFKKLINLKKKISVLNKDDFISRAEIIMNYFDYHENIKEFFDILRVILKIKEHSDDNNQIFYINDLISAYQSKISNLEFNYFNEQNKNLKTKREKILNEMIDYCLKCGEWQKYCELNIESGNWKKAIIAAPNVSVNYWEKLTKDYAKFLEEKDSKEKNINQNEKIINFLNCNDNSFYINECIKNKDFNSAKIVWMTKKIKEINSKKINENNNKNLLKIKDFDDLELKLNNSEENKYLNSIIYEIVKENLLNGFNIFACCSFLSIKNINLALKTLIRTNELIMAYILMIITNNKLFEYEIYLGFLISLIKIGNYEKQIDLINYVKNKNIKIFLFVFLKKYVQIKENEKKEFENLLNSNEINLMMKLIINNNYEEIFNKINEYFEILVENISNFNLNEINLLNIIEMFRFNKIFDWEEIYKKNLLQNIYLKILLLGLFYEILNKNLKNIFIIVNEIFLLNVNLNEKESIIFNLSLKCLFNFSKNKYEKIKEKIKEKIDLKKIEDKNIENIQKIQNNFNNFKNYEIKKYTCDNLNKFYIIKEELFPSKNSENLFSFLSNKKINGKKIKIGKNFITQSESLEIFKFSNKNFGLEKETFFP